MSPNRLKHREAFRKIGAAISALNPQKNIDAYHGGKGSNPWRVVKGATGYYGMQIDNRPGVCRRVSEEPVHVSD